MGMLGKHRHGCNTAGVARLRACNLRHAGRSACVTLYGAACNHSSTHLCIQASVHVWPAAAALRVAGTLSLAAGDASCLCTQPLVEPCRVAIDLERCTARPSGTEGTLVQPADQAVPLVRLIDQDVPGLCLSAAVCTTSRTVGQWPVV